MTFMIGSMLAALGAGLVASRDDIAGALPAEREFRPGAMPRAAVVALQAKWKSAVARALLGTGQVAR